MTRIQQTIASTVREVIRTHFPEDYTALCHAYAVVGANLASIALDKAYRPVAGLAAIDSGAGTLITMADERAFANDLGGSYHCWIESVEEPGQPKELVDFTFSHNRVYALRNGYQWAGAASPRYLWGPFDALTMPGELRDLQPGFGKEKIWLQECDAGVHWMAQHLEINVLGYIELTAAALRVYRKQAAHWPDATPIAALPSTSQTSPRTPHSAWLQS